MARLELRKEVVVFAPLLLPRVGLRLRAQKIKLLIAPFAASFSSGKSNGVVAANVMRHARQRKGKEEVGFWKVMVLRIQKRVQVGSRRTEIASLTNLHTTLGLATTNTKR